MSNPDASQPQAPAAKPVAVRHEWHGETFIDEFAWLRERENPEVLDYLKAENAYTDAMTASMKPLEEQLYKEMLGRIKQTDLSVPVERDGYSYYSRTEEGQQYPIHCRRKADPASDEEVLLNLNEMAAGLEFFSLGAMEVSNDGRWLAYTSDTTGMRRYRLCVKNLDTGSLTTDAAERVTSVDWANDNQTLFYTTEDEVTKRSNQLWRHRRGGTAELIYEETDELYHMGVGRTRDRELFLLTMAATDSTEARYWPAANPAAAPRVLLARERDHKYDVSHRAGLFYIRSNRGAKNFRLVTAPADDPRPDNWRELVAHDPSVLLDDFDLFRDYGVLWEKRAALTQARVWDFAAATWQAIEFPESVYAVGGAANPVFTSSRYRYHYQSMTTPPSVMERDLARGETRVLKQQEVLGGYDPAQYASQRLWALARDGARIPISLVYRRGREGQSGPLLLYGYGAYGYGMEATFSSARISLLDRGLTYAIAHVRGGNELGEGWHDAGMLMQKQNTFHDFADCTEFLVRAGWTTPAQLVAQGGSAGGLLIGAAVNQRPDLYGAAHLAVPFVDVLNTMMDASLPLTVGEYLEWGDPNQAAAFHYMLGYSPYDNLREGRYPALLVTTSLNDSQVMYWEPAKYVAKLRRLNGAGVQVMLKTNLGAGHGGASGRFDRLREIAFEYAWMLRQIEAYGRDNSRTPEQNGKKVRNDRRSLFLAGFQAQGTNGVTRR